MANDYSIRVLTYDKLIKKYKNDSIYLDCIRLSMICKNRLSPDFFYNLPINRFNMFVDVLTAEKEIQRIEMEQEDNLNN